MMVLPGQSDPLGRRPTTYLVPLDRQVPPVTQDLLDPLVHRDPMGPKDLMDDKVQSDRWARLAPPGPTVVADRQVLQAPKGRRRHRVIATTEREVFTTGMNEVQKKEKLVSLTLP